MKFNTAQNNMWFILECLDLRQIEAGAARRSPTIAALDAETRTLVSREYRRFLFLAATSDESTPMMSALVDELWHEHLLRSASYRDVQERLGVTLDHEPVDAPDQRAGRAEREGFAMRYEAVFGEPPPENVWSLDERCRGKPCHSPTPCRCRRVGLATESPV